MHKKIRKISTVEEVRKNEAQLQRGLPLPSQAVLKAGQTNLTDSVK